ncbi:MAG: PAS domain-containing protein [Alphaproteobacteria bacterium]|nr:PAS domain-containing protein [Alphaproteobacteria bacterium]
MEEASLVRLMDAAFDSIGEGITIVDRDLRLVMWNQRFLDLYGFSGDSAKIGPPMVAMARHGIAVGVFPRSTDPAE